MKKLITLTAVLALGLTATACTTTKEPGPGRVTYAIEAFTVYEGTETSVLVPVEVDVRVENLTDHNLYIREGRTGGWLILPWQGPETLSTPARQQFSYELDTKLTDFRLSIKATIQAEARTVLRCVILNTDEFPIGTADEVVIDSTGTGTVHCASQ